MSVRCILWQLQLPCTAVFLMVFSSGIPILSFDWVLFARFVIFFLNQSEMTNGFSVLRRIKRIESSRDIFDTKPTGYLFKEL